jgi:hypothetical protein
MHGSLVAFDAGTSIARLRKEEPDPFPLDADALGAGGRGPREDREHRGAHYPISPIILPARAGQALDALEDKGTRVCFDLDGDGVQENCSGCARRRDSSSGTLSARVASTSGRELFGNASMVALLPGPVTGRSMRWTTTAMDGSPERSSRGCPSGYDLDSDGRSGLGEVLPIERTEVVGLATRADAREGTALRATCGMLPARRAPCCPTYDWYADCTR